MLVVEPLCAFPSLYFAPDDFVQGEGPSDALRRLFFALFNQLTLCAAHSHEPVGGSHDVKDPHRHISVSHDGLAQKSFERPRVRDVQVLLQVPSSDGLAVDLELGIDTLVLIQGNVKTSVPVVRRAPDVGAVAGARRSVCGEICVRLDQSSRRSTLGSGLLHLWWVHLLIHCIPDLPAPAPIEPNTCRKFCWIYTIRSTGQESRAIV